MATYEKIGKRWKDIASHFEGRPPVHCRNRVQSLVRARRRAAAAVRKAAQAKLKAKRPIAEKKAIIAESMLEPSDLANEVRIMVSPLLSFGLQFQKQKTPNFFEEDSASSGTPRNLHQPSPSSHTSELRQDVQPQCSIPVPTHSTQEIRSSFPVTPASSPAYRPFVAVYPSDSHPPYRDYDSRATSVSPPFWGTHPQLVQPNLCSDGSSDVPSILPLCPPLYDPCPTPRWSALWSPFGSQLLDCSVRMQTSVPTVSHPPPNTGWWAQENTYKYSGDFCKEVHRSQVLDLTPLNYPICYSAQDPGDPELLYLPSPLPVDAIPTLMIPFESLSPSDSSVSP